jgi:hypothetical protein
MQQKAAKAVKAAQYQVGKSIPSQQKHFKSGNAALRQHMPTQRQRNTVQVFFFAKATFNSSEMMHKSTKAASTPAQCNTSQRRQLNFKSTNAASRRHMHFQGGTCRLNTSSMQHKSTKCSTRQRKQLNFKSAKAIQVGENISSQRRQLNFKPVKAIQVRESISSQRIKL